MDYIVLLKLQMPQRIGSIIKKIQIWACASHIQESHGMMSH
jgi:hypothetical protein